MSAPGIAPVAAIEDDLEQIRVLLAAVDEATPGGAADLLGGFPEQDEFRRTLVRLKLQVANGVGTAAAGGGRTIIQQPGGGGGQPVGLNNLIDALQADVVAAEFDRQIGANSDILNSPLSPSSDSVVYRTTWASDTAAVPIVTMTNGQTTVTPQLNDGGQLVADTLNVFDVTGVTRSMSVNFQLDAAANLDVFTVKEITAEAP